MSVPVTLDPLAPVEWSSRIPLSDLTRRIRSIVGTEWARGVERRRDILVPDQNGCLETSRRKGGTLGTSADVEASFDLRIGVAKTKGKFRVVTMQSARVKEKLSPLHDSLYDYLSRRKWLVRGEFTRDHARLVLDDVREGEEIISGDYEAATNNIDPRVSHAIALVLAESPYLTDEERFFLVSSFDPANLVCRTSGSSVLLKRGQMMGSLLSFPMLCLLNRACFTMACTRRSARTKVRGPRTCIINGDDVAFAGDQLFFEEWVSVTSTFGLVVNKKKTGRSGRFLELNSRVYDLLQGRMLPKPVLSFLLPETDTGCLLTRLWDGARHLSASALRLALFWMSPAIQLRGVDISGIPSRFRRVLLKQRWFRSTLLSKPAQRVVGVERCWPIISRDIRPPSSLLPIYDLVNRQSMKALVEMFQGAKLRPPLFSMRAQKRIYCPDYVRLSFRNRWKWRWSLPVLMFWEFHSLPTVDLSHRSWEDDHSDLAIDVEVVKTASVCPAPSLLKGFIPYNDNVLRFWG